MTSTYTHQISVTDSTSVDLSISDRGHGHPFLLLHGGGGPATVTRWADALAQARPARVITPIHPGFGGTHRPGSLSSVRDLAQLYLNLLEALGLADVTVIGNSVGGWIAAEMATAQPARVSSFVLIDAVGLEVPGHPVIDVFSLPPDQIAQHTFADPDTYAPDPASLSREARDAIPGNMASLKVYAGTDMTDPTLQDRLPDITAPTLVLWGQQDRIASPEIGRAYANAITNATFELIGQAGHLPQLEAAEKVTEHVWNFADAHSVRVSAALEN